MSWHYLQAPKEKKMKVDKKEALQRLATIEKEAEKLRKIIEEPNLIYDDELLYVGLHKGRPYILIGKAGTGYFRFHSFASPWMSEQGWQWPIRSAQECIDAHRSDGFEISGFSNVRDGFRFFLEHYKG